MSRKYLSNRQKSLNIGVSSYTENEQVLGVIGNVSVSGIVSASEFIGDNLNISNIDVDGQTELDDLNVSGVSTFAGDIDANGNLDVDGITELDITNISETLNVSGVSTFASDVDINASIDVDGHTELDDLNVSGVSTFIGDVSFGSIDVDGHTELDDLNVSGVSTFAGDIDANGNLDVDGHTELDTVNVSIAATIENLTIGSGVAVTTILDEDDMVSNSDTSLATQQSIKTYVDDSILGAVNSIDLDFSGDSGIGTVNLATEVFNIEGTANEIETVGSGNTITIGLPNSISVGQINSGVVTASSFVGDLTGTATTATNLSDASNITTGTIDDARLPDVITSNINSTAGVSTFANIETDQLTVGSGIAVTTILDEDDMVSNSDTSLATQQSIKTYVDDSVIAGVASVELDFSGDSGIGTVNLATEVFDIEGTPNEIETVGSGVTITIGLPDNVTIGQDLTVTRDVNILRNLDVTGNITVGGTSATLFTTTLEVEDPDIVLGIRTDAFGNDISTDNTANHGGIAIASTDGSPLVNLNVAGIETLPPTYKKIMWFKSGTFAGLATDAWLTNYAFGVGTTQISNGTILAVGNIELNDDDITAIRNIDATGIITASSFVGDGSQLTNISSDSIVGVASIAAYANVAGIATYATNAGIATYATNAGIATYATNAGIASYADVAGIATVAENLTGSPSIEVTDINATGVSTFQGNVNLPDSTFLRLGDSGDLQLHHDGFDSYIRDTGAGALRIRGEQQIQIQNALGTETYANFNNNGTVELYYDNSKKFETTGAGVTVFGTTETQQLNVTGVSTFQGNIDVISTDGGSAAAPELKLYRNSASPADADYLGQIKFAGESDTGVERNYAKITGKIDDASNTSEDGILEFAFIKAGSQNINARFKSTELMLLNGTDFSVAGDSTFTGAIDANGDIDVDGHTELDDLNVSGVSTFQDDVNIGVGGTTAFFDVSTGNLGIGTNNPNRLLTLKSTNPIIGLTDYDSGGEFYIQNSSGSGILNADFFRILTNSSSEVVRISSTGDVGIGTNSASQLLDVNGNARFRGAIYDNNNVVGTANSILVSTGSGVVWADPGTTVGIATNADLLDGLNSTQFLRSDVADTKVGVTTFQDDIFLGDNDVLNFGDGNDLQIFHDGTDDLISSSGATLKITGSRVVINNAANTENQAVFTAGGSVALYNNADKKFETTGAGVTVFGTTESQQLDVNGAARFRTEIRDSADSAGTANYVLASGGAGGNWSWQPVTNVGAGTLDAIFVRQDGANVGASGTNTTLDFYENFSLTQPTAGIASIRLADTLNISQLNVSGVSTFQDDIFLGDNDALNIGDNNDLRILHDGNNSYISDIGSGDLFIQTNSEIRFRNTSGPENMALMKPNGSVDLFYDAVKKFETTADGILVDPNVGLGTTAGNADATQDLAVFQTGNSNTSLLKITETRDVDGTNWTSANTRIQKTIDSTNMGYIQFNGDGNTYGIEFGTFGSEKFAVFRRNAEVELYYDDSLKFETTNTGIEVFNGASTSATIAGPDEIIIDPATVGDNTGSVRIKGDLFVDGTQTIINSSTIELADFIVGIASTATTDTLADGAGIQIGPDNTFLYEYNSGTNPSLKSSENLNVATGKHYQIGETEVLNATTLGSGVVNSSLTNLGTLTELRLSGSFYDNSNNDGISGQVLTSTGSGVQWITGTTAASGQDIVTQQAGTPYYITASDITSGVSTAGFINSNVVIRTGDLGLGTNNPTERVDVEGTDGARVAFTNTGTRRWTIGNAEDASTSFTITDQSASSEKLRIDINGDVGIGTDNPGYKLEVAGDIKLGTNGTGTIWFDDTSSTVEKISAAGSSLDLYSDATVRFYESDANTLAFTVDTNSARAFFEGDDNTYWHRPAADTHAFVNAGSETVRITSTGSFGIGTNNPQRKLHVNNSASGATYLQVTNADTGATLTDGSLLGLDTDENLIVWNQEAKAVRIGTSAFERMRVTSTGDVGIGTDNPDQDLHLYRSGSDSVLHVEAIGADAILDLDNTGDGNFSGINFTRERSTGAGANGGSIFMPSQTANNESHLYIQAQSASAQAGVTGDLSDNNGVRIKLVGGASSDSHISFETNDEAVRITSGGNVGIGTDNPGYKLEVNGSFAATTKSFVIDHPTKEGMKLRYGSLEGPENGVYVRGRLNGNNTIELPDYWTGLVDEETITVNLTPIGRNASLHSVIDIVDNTVVVESASGEVNCFYTVFGERKDVEKLEVEF